MNHNDWMQRLIEMLEATAPKNEEVTSRVVVPGAKGSSEVAAALIRSSATAKTVAAHLKGMLSDRKGFAHELGVIMFWARNPIGKTNACAYDLPGNWEALVLAAGIHPGGMRGGFVSEAERMGYSRKNAEILFDVEFTEARSK